MDHDGWLKATSYLSSVCCSSTLNIQVLFYDDHVSHFDVRALKIIWIHHIQSFILKVGDSVNDQPNDNGQKLKLKNMYGYTIMN